VNGDVKAKTYPAGDGNKRRRATWAKRAQWLVALAFMASLSFGQSAFNAGPGYDGPGNELRNGMRTGKLAAELQSLSDRVRLSPSANQSVRVIVQFTTTPTQHHFNKVQSRGGKLNASLQLVNAGAFSLPASALKDLADDDEVVSITPDNSLKAMDEYTNDAVGVATAWQEGYQGSGIGVAIIDSGVNDSSPDLRSGMPNQMSTTTQMTTAQTYATQTSRVVYHQDFTGTPTSNSLGASWDLYGHGTHVAGIVGGDGSLSNGQYVGLTPNINLVDLRVLDQNGIGTDSMVIAAIQRAIALKNTYNIRVINLSLGRGISTSYANDPLCQAVESAWKSGIVVVVAAGNYGRLDVDGINGYGTVTAPGNDPFVITVGAMKSMETDTRTDDRIASYSSKGPTTFDHVAKPDLVAPGNLVVSVAASGSTLILEYPANLISAGGRSLSQPYFTLSGTSMATPAVSAAAALLLNQNSSLTPDQIKARLMKTAYKTFPASSVATDPVTGQTYTSYYDLFTVGAGYLDINAAMANNDKAPATVGSALSPRVILNANGTVSLANGNSVIAGSSVVWGTSVVWGNSVVWGTNVNGSSVVWGTSSLSASSVVWGNSTLAGYSVVWGTSGACASSVVWGTATANNQASSIAINGEQ
jgi:serine protease AprX